MGEKFYQYVWQYMLFCTDNMVTIDGQKVEVISPGVRNTDAGPDFFNAQVTIDGMLWVGNVEIHVNTSSWYEHNHHNDHAYDNVVLHVVVSSDGRVVRDAKGRVIPEMVIRCPEMIMRRYNEVIESQTTIKCSKYISEVPSLELNSWLDRLLYERFEERNKRVSRLFEEFCGDWNQICFCLLARSLGGSINGEAMELLARCTPVRILAKHNNQLQMEALLMGQSGLLPMESEDEYVKLLRREYDFLREKFSLQPINGAMWKYMRLRPGNFPVIRISQLVAVVKLANGNFESVYRSMDVKTMMKTLEVSASKYWDTHYVFGKKSDKESQKKIGLSTRRLIIVNAIIPFVFAYARRFGKETEQLNIMKMLSFLPMEKNSKLEQWKACGVEPHDEGEAQALLLLRKEYCEKSRCLMCRIGHNVFKKGNSVFY